jgi:hypothetical protein
MKPLMESLMMKALDERLRPDLTRLHYSLLCTYA